MLQETLLLSSFWKKVEEIVKLSEPIVKLLRLFDGSKAIAGKVYKACFNCIEDVKGLGFSRDKEAVLVSILTKRWEMLHSPLHSCGYVVEPEYHDDEQHTNEEVMLGFHTTMERVLPNVEDQADAIVQLGKYRQKEGLFALPAAFEAAKRMPAYCWWQQFGAGCPQLQV